MVGKKKISDTEFEVMKVVWSNQAPITTTLIMEQLGKKKKWKLPTILTIMTRLVEKGFLRTEKAGRERNYYPLVAREDYLAVETKEFLEMYHENSLSSLVSMLYGERGMNQKELDALAEILRKGGGEQ